MRSRATLYAGIGFSLLLHGVAFALLQFSPGNTLEHNQGEADGSISVYLGSAIGEGWTQILEIPANHQASTSDSLLLADAFDIPSMDSRKRQRSIRTSARPTREQQSDLNKTRAVGEQPQSRTAASMHGAGGLSVGGAGGGDRIRARLVSGSMPKYPQSARNAEWEGVVWLEIQIEANGRVSQAQLIKPSGCTECDREAVDTVMLDWRFLPAYAHGEAQSSREQITIVYKLE